MTEPPFRAQRTLSRPVSCAGVGLHTGAAVEMSIHPAAAGRGIAFLRADLEADLGADAATIPARHDRVSRADHCTTLDNGRGASIGTVEHVLAALAGCGVDNALVRVSGPEAPIMDGSAAAFADMVEDAGLVAQGAPRRVIIARRPVSVEKGEGRAALAPLEEDGPAHDLDGGWGVGLRLSVTVEYPGVGRQALDLWATRRAFRDVLCDARTFGYMADVEAQRARGLCLGAGLRNAVGLNADGSPANPEGFRHPDEIVRHKALDALGDMALAGMPLRGRYTGVRPGHDLHRMLLKVLFADAGNYHIEDA